MNASNVNFRRHGPTFSNAADGSSKLSRKKATGNPATSSATPSNRPAVITSPSAKRLKDSPPSSIPCWQAQREGKPMFLTLACSLITALLLCGVLVLSFRKKVKSFVAFLRCETRQAATPAVSSTASTTTPSASDTPSVGTAAWRICVIVQRSRTSVLARQSFLRTYAQQAYQQQCVASSQTHSHSSICTKPNPPSITKRLWTG